MLAVHAAREPVLEHLLAEVRVQLTREPRVVRGSRRGAAAAQRQQDQRETKPFFHVSPLRTARAISHDQAGVRAPSVADQKAFRIDALRPDG